MEYVRRQKQPTGQLADTAEEICLTEALKQSLDNLNTAGEQAMDAVEFRRSLQQLTEMYAGIVRTDAGLREGLAKLEEIKQRGFARGDKGAAYCVENQSLLLTAEAVLRAAGRVRGGRRDPLAALRRQKSNLFGLKR